MHHQARSQELQDCIKSCKDCHAICVATVDHCLTLGGQHATTKNIRLLLDCIQICASSEDFMLRSSELQAKLCGLCAEICDSCAAACATSSADQQMKACISACQSCAEACRKMVISQAPQRA